MPQASKAYLLIAMSLKFVSTQQLLKNTELTEQGLSDRQTIDMRDAIQIVHNINKYSSNAIWPVLLGQHLGVSTHGPVGYASISAATVGSALSVFVQWYVVRSECYHSQVIETEDSFEIVIVDTTGDEVYEAFFFEALMRALEVLVETIMGQSSLLQTTIHMKTTARNRRSLMTSTYQSQLFFQQKNNKMIVSKHCWYLDSPLYDKDSHEFNVAKCKQLHAQMHANNRIDHVVKDIIRKHFENAIVANEIVNNPPSLTNICQSVHQSERTVIRKLNTQNTSYKQILARQRHESAMTLLANKQYSIYQISEILGYKEAANFTRAFKKWQGESPHSYRQNFEEVMD